MPSMLSLEEAQSRILALAPSLPIEEIAVEQAQGRFLAEDLLAKRTQPPADLSAMDGFAICGEGPWQLMGESRAGAPYSGEISAGECTRISTGAHLPKGADRVLIQENARVDGETIICIEDFPDVGQHIRRRGFDFAEGDVLLDAGTSIEPAQIALAVTAGHGSLKVMRSLRIAILDSGDELASDPENCAEDQIPASNGIMLSAMVAQLGCDVRRIGPVSDNLDALASALNLAEDADILVTSGGVSVGDHDLIKPALEAWGAELDFWKVAIKPGKPLMLARRGERRIIGLPGNPVSSYVTAVLFLLPMIHAAMGSTSPLPFRGRAQLTDDLPPTGPRREFLRAIWNGEAVSLVDSQDSSALQSLAKSNCLIDRPPHSTMAKAGTDVPIILPQTAGFA